MLFCLLDRCFTTGFGLIETGAIFGQDFVSFGKLAIANIDGELSIFVLF